MPQLSSVQVSQLTASPLSNSSPALGRPAILQDFPAIRRSTLWRSPREAAYASYLAVTIGASVARRTHSKEELAAVARSEFGISKTRANKIRDYVLDLLAASAWTAPGRGRRH